MKCFELCIGKMLPDYAKYLQIMPLRNVSQLRKCKRVQFMLIRNSTEPCKCENLLKMRTIGNKYFQQLRLYFVPRMQITFMKKRTNQQRKTPQKLKHRRLTLLSVRSFLALHNHIHKGHDGREHGTGDGGQHLIFYGHSAAHATKQNKKKPLSTCCYPRGPPIIAKKSQSVLQSARVVWVERRLWKTDVAAIQGLGRLKTQQVRYSGSSVEPDGRVFFFVRTLLPRWVKVNKDAVPLLPLFFQSQGFNPHAIGMVFFLSSFSWFVGGWDWGLCFGGICSSFVIDWRLVAMDI